MTTKTSLTALTRGLTVLQDTVAKLCILLCSLALISLVATFGWLVFGRYVLNATPTWVEQLALLLVCYIVFLGAAVGVREQTHLGVTLFRDALPPALRGVVVLAGDFVLMVFGAVMCLSSLELFQFGWSTLLPMLNIPESFRTLSAVLCGGLICLFCATRILLGLLNAFSPNSQDQNELKRA